MKGLIWFMWWLCILDVIVPPHVGPYDHIELALLVIAGAILTHTSGDTW